MLNPVVIWAILIPYVGDITQIQLYKSWYFTCLLNLVLLTIKTTWVLTTTQLMFFCVFSKKLPQATSLVSRVWGQHTWRMVHLPSRWVIQAFNPFRKIRPNSGIMIISIRLRVKNKKSLVKSNTSGSCLDSSCIPTIFHHEVQVTKKRRLVTVAT